MPTNNVATIRVTLLAGCKSPLDAQLQPARLQRQLPRMPRLGQRRMRGLQAHIQAHGARPLCDQPRQPCSTPRALPASSTATLGRRSAASAASAASSAASYSPPSASST
jgi:hypothetical protein